VQSYFTRNVCQNFMSIGQLDAKHRVRQGLGYYSLDFNRFFLRHSPLYKTVNTLAAPFVMAMVCS